MSAGADGYAALWCKSAYSFLEGASQPDELVEEAHRLGVRALALTDRDGIHGVVRAWMKARESGLHLIIGGEITLFDNTSLVLLATSRKGHANLCRLLSRGRLRSPKGTSRVSLKEVCEHAADLIALVGAEQFPVGGETDPNPVAGELKDAFGERLYALLIRHRAAGEVVRERRVREQARRFGLPTVAGAEVLYHTPARRDLQDVLTCIRHGVTLSTAGRLIRPNAGHALPSPHAFSMLFADDPDSVGRTLDVAGRCRFDLSEIRYRYPVEAGEEGGSVRLRELTRLGARQRYPRGVPNDVAAQIAKELALIHELEYEGYFLTMHEIVRFCREADILFQGRGSAANSAVCYCLGITAVDPVKLGLLFERFLSRERAEPPDIDMDIEHNRREEVIQHVYRKYGRDHAAMVANFIRYRTRSALRDVGRALGFAETAIERIVRALPRHHVPDVAACREAGLDPEHPAHARLLKLVGEIQDFPRHLSIHPGGFLLGHEPVHDIVPIENATMPDRTVVQWDKNDLEDLGLFKVDLLGLGALNVVHRAFDLVKQHTGESLSLATIPADDEPTYEMIRAADTVGVFQIESRAQMSMLPRLKPRNYYDLVIEVSIVRPGPISGGMVHPYLRRKNGEEPVDYPHPSLEPVLKKTLGIPLFQEQVMQLAMVAADYTPGEADQLRRDMAAWRSTGRIERHRRRLVDRMTRKGIAQEFAERIFEQIRGFGEYGFPESHAASFALIAYATSWLKRHRPAAFLCAMLNAWPMGFYSPATLVEDGKRHGVEVLPVDVTVSDSDCTLELREGRDPSDTTAGSTPDFAVRMGLRYVKGLHANAVEGILTARTTSPFADLRDFTRRTALDNGALARLAEAGALEPFDGNRRDALWQVLGAGRETPDLLPLEAAEAGVHFASLDLFDTIGWDHALTDHSTRGHPLAPLRPELTRRRLPDAATVRGMKDGAHVSYAGQVICRQRPGTAKGVLFMTLEDETGFVNLVVWERVFEKHQLLAKTASFLGASGKLQVESGVVHLVVNRLWIPRLDAAPGQTRSRDFH